MTVDKSVQKDKRLKFLTAPAITIALTFALNVAKATGQKPPIQGEDLFKQRCASCHTVGGGAKSGPDLAVVRGWEQPEVRKNIERMQAQAGKLAPAEVDALVDYLTKKPAAANPRDNAGATGPSDEVVEPLSADEIKAGKVKMSPEELQLLKRFSPPPNFTPEAAIAKASKGAASGKKDTSGPGDWESEGAKLYSGRKPLKNGGSQCAACHLQKDSKSAPDLSEIAHEKKGSRLLKFLSAPDNRTMKEEYEKHPITEEEAAALSSYFSTIK